MRHKPQKATDHICQVGMLWGSGGGVMFQAMFTWATLGPLVPTEDTITKRCVDVLANHLHPFVNIYYQ